MKLILIYGPPGVGKLTVAKELQKITGFKLLHNHLIANLLGPIFGFGNLAVRTLNGNIRIKIYEEASKLNFSGLISTFSYHGDRQAKIFVQRCINITRKLGGKTFFIGLSCDSKKLEKRIRNSSRVRVGKITSVALHRKILRRVINPLAKIPKDVVGSLHIDNSRLKPRRVAVQIKQFVNKI